MTPISFYTSKGDDGYTGQLGEGRAPKEGERIEAVGAVDEANAALGMARATSRAPETAGLLLRIQRDLYGLMGELASTPQNAARFRAIGAPQVAWLEAQIAGFGEQVEMTREFIVPGDTSEGAAMDLARAVVRRAERRVAGLFHQGLIENVELLRYLNRLSSLCFLLELYENQWAGRDKPTLAKADDQA